MDQPMENRAEQVMSEKQLGKQPIYATQTIRPRSSNQWQHLLLWTSPLNTATVCVTIVSLLALIPSLHPLRLVTLLISITMVLSAAINTLWTMLSHLFPAQEDPSSSDSVSYKPSVLLLNALREPMKSPRFISRVSHHLSQMAVSASDGVLSLLLLESPLASLFVFLATLVTYALSFTFSTQSILMIGTVLAFTLLPLAHYIQKQLELYQYSYQRIHSFAWQTIQSLTDLLQQALDTLKIPITIRTTQQAVIFKHD